MFNKNFKTFEEYSQFYGLTFDGVEHQCFDFSAGGNKLVGQVFQPKEYRATVIIVHGYLVHCGTFGKFIKYMLDNHMAVAMFDLPGHGLSGGDRGVTSDFSQYTIALDEFLSIIKEKLHGPFHIVGHSTGGAIVMDYITGFGSGDFDKVVLAAPLVRFKLWHLSKIGCAIYMPFMKHIFRLFRNISSDAQYVDFLKHRDHLQVKSISLRWVRAIFKWEKKISKMPVVNKPVFVVQGTNDTTVAWKYNLKFILAKFKNADIEFVENAQHEFFNEAKQYRDEVFELIRDYLVKK
ncbi:MAG: alpha/beta hydrolase [Planctomycetaceae bacterium]|nr:alpha/beta hydrolase [Planctomycetaceae bacterium]